MKHYQVTLAQNVRSYSRQTVQAETPEEACKIALDKDDWCHHEFGEEADADEPTLFADEADEDGDPIEDGDQIDEIDVPGYVYKTELMRFAKMLAEADIHAHSLVNAKTGALMDVQSIRRTARHILKMD
jgi:hypothetical protein